VRSLAFVGNDPFAGVYEIKFDGSNLASGVYFYRLSAQTAGTALGAFTETKRLLLIR
jgi:hypothetical protein